MRKVTLWLCLIFSLAVLIECASLASLYLFKKMKTIRYSPVRTASLSPRHVDALKRMMSGQWKYLGYDADLGWTIKPDVAGTRYHSNSQGIRADYDYTLKPRDGTIRISTFGDSFTHCDDVKNHQTWQAALQQSHDKLEVINFGVPGYGLDQAYLRFKKNGTPYNAQIVLIGYMSGDIFRGVNRYRPFFQAGTGLPLAKPRFILNNNELQLLENPIPSLSHYQALIQQPKTLLSQLGINDYFYQVKYRRGALDILPSVRLVKAASYKLSPLWDKDSILRNGLYNENSEAYKVTIKTFDKFVEEARRYRSKPIIVVFPYDLSILAYRRNQTKEYAPLLDYFQSKSYDYIDIMDTFETYGRKYQLSRLFNGRHYSELGNQIVAKHMLQYLRSKSAL